MRGLLRPLIPLAAFATMTSVADADDAVRPAPARQDAVPCCNPAASNKSIRPPKGVYVGMPLQPGDLGYKPKSRRQRSD